MSYTKFSGVAFGSRKSGLSTVGYRLYNTNGTASGSRVTAGVAETAPGNYAATVTFPDDFTGEIRWDTGEGSPRYASDFINPDAAADPGAILDLADGVESGLTLRKAFRGIVAVLLGKSINGGQTFRDFNDTKDRISAVVDENDNRVAVERDLT